MKRKLNKVMAAVLVAVMVALLVPALTMTTFAETQNMTDYIFVPVKSGEEASELFVNSTDDSGTDATAMWDDLYEDITLTFPKGVAGDDGTIERKRTEMNLDLSCVSDRRYKYVSFEITPDQLMDLVITFEPYTTKNNLDSGARPYSLYFTDGGYMGPTQHRRKDKYETTDAATGYKSNIQGTWWVKDAKIIQPYTAGDPINVTMIASSMTGNAVKDMNVDGTLTSRLEYDEVQVFINGVRKGQLKIAHRLGSWYNQFLHFAHYTTNDIENNVYLKNLEIGFCEKSGRDVLNVLDPNDADKTWEFPEGDNTFVSITLPMTSDYSYGITSSIGAGGSTFCWYKNELGVLANWAVDDMPADGIQTQTLADMRQWENYHAWAKPDGVDEVTVTYEINKTFGTVECYDSLGHWRKAYRDIPTSVSIHDVVGDVKPTKVVSGSFAGKGSRIINSSNTTVSEFDANTGKLRLTEFGVTGKNKDLRVMFGWQDANGKLLRVDTDTITSSADGLYAISPARDLGSEPPAGASALTTYIWDESTNKPIRISSKLVGSLIPIADVTSARLLGRTEAYNSGYSFNWPNSGIEFTFEGTEAQVNVSAVAQGGDRLTDNYFTVYVDGVAQPDRLKISSTGWHTIASGLDDEEHTIKMVRSSEAKDARLWISDIRANNAKPTEKKDKLIEFYGDSYAAGYGNLGVQEGSTYTWGVAENSDAQKAYPYLVAENFNADLNVIAYSGKGMEWNSTANAGLDIRELSAYADVMVNGDTRTPATWDFANAETPDLVVIYLGTNDSAYAEATADGFKEAYKGFIETIRERYGDVKILCVGRHEDGFTTEVEAVVNEVKTSDSNIGFYRFDKFGTSSIYTHPNVTEAAASAEELNAAISEFIGW